MPFYVDYSLKRRTIAIRDASPVQFIICYEIGSIITLEATLNDYVNHRNVTFDWVQIEGTLATLSHPNDLVTTFEYTDNSDKIFRFYIDKDTARETYIDCRVYHTPISFMGAGAKLHNHSGTSILKIVDKTDSVKTAGYTREVTPSVPGVPAVVFTFEYVLPTSLLTISDTLEVFYSPDARVDPYILKETWTTPYPGTYVAIEGYYTFVLSVTYSSGIKKKYYSHIQVSNPKEVTSDELVHTTDELFTHNVDVVTRSIVRFTFKKVLVTSTMEFNSPNEVKTSNIRRFTHKLQEIEDTWDNPLFIGYNVKTSNIVKLDPSGVGSSG